MRFLRLGILILVLMSLHGCLLYYFFAPKISVTQLPGSSDLQGFKMSYARMCGKCHLLIDPEYFRTNATIESLLKRYRDQKVITKGESKDIATYINVVLAEN